MSRTSRVAFTLLEAMVVVIVVGVLAATAVPAMNVLAGMNRAAATSEIARNLELARARALATGRPSGVKFSVFDQTMSQVWIATSGGTPAAARSQLGTASEDIRFGDFGSAALESYTGGDGITSEGTIWFAADGTPHSRTSGGVLLSPWTGDASIKVEDETAVTVRRISGVVK